MSNKKTLLEEVNKMRSMMGLPAKETITEDTHEKELKRVKDNAADGQQVEERENTPDAPEANPGQEKMASGNKVQDGTTQQVEERENTPDAPEANPAEEKKAVNESEEIAEEEVNEGEEVYEEEEVAEEEGSEEEDK